MTSLSLSFDASVQTKCLNLANRSEAVLLKEFLLRSKVHQRLIETNILHAFFSKMVARGCAFVIFELPFDRLKVEIMKAKPSQMCYYTTNYLCFRTRNGSSAKPRELHYQTRSSGCSRICQNVHANLIDDLTLCHTENEHKLVITLRIFHNLREQH